jgi:hypothetical protein
MGYQIKVKFREVDTSVGDSDTEEQKDAQEHIRRIGKQQDDRDDALLASELMYWNFRKDIEVLSIEVMEFVRRTVNVSLIPDGVKIRGKKYTIRQAPVIEEQESVTPSETPLTQTHVPTPTPTPTPTQVPQGGQRAIGTVVCNPGDLADRDPQLLDQLVAAGFRAGNTYQLLARKPSDGVNPPMITIISDNGDVKDVNGDLFDEVSQGLSNTGDTSGPAAASDAEDGPEPRLSFGNMQSTEMPILRG